MNANLNILVPKKIIEIIPLDLDKDGYGPKGKHTRAQWQDECRWHLQKSSLAAWINSWRFNVEVSVRSLNFLVDDENFLNSRNFPYEIIYEDGTKSTVSSPYWFEDSTYPLDFVGQRFSEGLMMSYVEIEVPILFTGARFSESVNFSGIKFKNEVDFTYANFLDFAIFRGSIFSGFAEFNKATFNRYSDFANAIFNSNTNFSETVFNAKLNFESVVFNNDVEFTHSIINEDGNFSEMVFNKDCSFFSAKFNNYANFYNSKFLKQCEFENVIFQKSVNFESVTFEKVGHFEQAKFIGEIPNFLGVDNSKTLLVFSEDKFFNKDDTTENAVKRIGQLKRLADEQGQTDQALMFNAFELNAKAKQPDASSLFKVFTWLYARVSNYGRSFGQPIAAYLVLVTITYLLALLAAANNSPQDCKGELWRVFSDMRDNGWSSCLSAELPEDKLKLNGYRAAFEYTTYRAAGVLDFSDNDKQTVAVSKRLFNADVEPTWMRFWGIFKAIASAALLFLAALGLRNKYRIK